jgi:hypothetical protein
MKNIKDYKNIKMGLEESTFYGNVDGLSLQNLFYIRNGYFPGCILFTYEARTSGDYYFDVKKVWDHLKATVAEDEQMELVPYVTKTLGDSGKEDRMSLCIVLNKSNIYARIEKHVTDSYILFGNDGLEAAEKLVEELKQFYVPPVGDSNIYWRICAS